MNKVFGRKLQRGIGSISADFDWLNLQQTIDVVVNMLSNLKFNKARIKLQYWDNTAKIINFLKENQVSEYTVEREYIPMHMKPGIIDIYFEKSFNPDFIQAFITKHFGHEKAQDDTLQVRPYFAIDQGTRIIAFLPYDDRGFYAYIIPTGHH